MATLIVGTFNCNNLFSRFNFKAHVDPALREGRRFSSVQLRRSGGKIIDAKPEAGTRRLAQRILDAAPDVLAVQEVEDRDTLRDFNRNHLGGRFAEQVLIEGNDPRFIDVGLLSRLPIGEVRSYQRYRHPALPDQPVFRRDFLLVEILNPKRRCRLFWVGVAHLKSQLVDWRIRGDAARRQAIDDAARVRRLETESIARILREDLGTEEKVFVCGDFNDRPESQALAPLLDHPRRRRHLVNLLPAFQRAPEARWTISHKEPHQPRAFSQYDYLLASRELARHVTRSWVARRETRPNAPDGSDHDPVMCEVTL